MKNVFWKHFNDVISRCTKKPMWPHWRNRATAWHLLLSLTPFFFTPFSQLNLFTLPSPRFFIFFLFVGGAWISCKWFTVLLATTTTAIQITIKTPFIYHIRNAEGEVENRFLTWNVWQIENACHPPPPFLMALLSNYSCTHTTQHTNVRHIMREPWCSELLRECIIGLSRKRCVRMCVCVAILHLQGFTKTLFACCIYRAFDQSLSSKMEQSWYLMLPVIIARGERAIGIDEWSPKTQRRTPPFSSCMFHHSLSRWKSIFPSFPPVAYIPRSSLLVPIYHVPHCYVTCNPSLLQSINKIESMGERKLKHVAY